MADSRDVEQRMHEQSGHRLGSSENCWACKMASTQAKGALRGKFKGEGLNTVNSDLIILNKPDCNENIAIHNNVVVNSHVIVARGVRSTRSTTNARVWKTLCTNPGLFGSYRAHPSSHGAQDQLIPGLYSACAYCLLIKRPFSHSRSFVLNMSLSFYKRAL